MPFNVLSKYLAPVDNSTLFTAALGAGAAYAAKIYASGRKNVWEREWGGKLIMIVAPPTPTTLALIDRLLQLPLPPQILYLPPLPSPLPDSLLTILHTIRLGIANDKLGQLHCEPLPATPAAVRHFVRKWAGAPMGTVGEGGRRVDAIVLGGGWECTPQPAVVQEETSDPAQDPEWTSAQFNYHLVTALLPSLLRAPPERDIRIVQLVSPAWAAALPGVQAGLEGRPAPAENGLAAAGAKRGITALLLQSHLRLVLDTLAAAAYSTPVAVPDPSSDKVTKKRDARLQSNILALSVVMPWARDEVVRPLWASGGLFNWITYILLLPFIFLLTPSPTKAVQSVLYALSAPVKFPGDDAPKAKTMDVGADGKITNKSDDDTDKITDPRRNGVRQGEVVRDCGIIDIPPVLNDPLLARATYEKIEKEVEAGVRASETREKAFGKKETMETK